ncbi:MAG: quinolinate synthase NadA [Blastocatellia bacterium]|nr:quinolinate synthase NadA [Chloracidobacterium sp.]MBL8183827.1 quinolinate synthase NadA [Blastocatellia bacterium]HBE84202.1 quinolinate synthase [Blastocatellia bacterium]HRJ89426.1 quinolinate synthase NadA [Pyrinomonadaceae bacterium]HRK51935.1 quinolinate synthase NadA [Pyrinomonadaceae bacterium]
MSAVTTRSAVLEDYLVMSDAEIAARIEEARRILGKRVVILGHHYQRDDVIRHADLTGDSYQLSVMASQTEAEYIVFCGVHFMAESADVVGKDFQRVILPDLGAGCSMADMASIDQVEDAWEQLRDIGVLKNKVAPITYMNSTAAIKAFCGRNEGVVCTSSNAVPLFDIYLKEFDKMFFFPDQHLGRNTGAKFGIPLDKMALWNPHEELGGNTEEQLHDAKLILWRGHCSVHGRFKPWHVDKIRQEVPGVKVLVHPECTREVVEVSDLDGSTSFIIKTVENSPPGSKWAIGTEVNLVNRLAQRFPDKEIHLLAPDLCMCATMYRIAPQNLAWAVENLIDGVVVNEIVVDDETRHFAKVALDRMIELTETRK